MDSGSENEEFYECDDDLDVDVETSEAKANTHDYKKTPPAGATAELANSHKTSSSNGCNVKPKAEVIEDNKRNIAEKETCNNNSKSENTSESKAQTISPVTLSKDVNSTKLDVEECLNNNRDIQTSIQESRISHKSKINTKRLDNDKSLTEDEPSTLLGEKCIIKEGSSTIAHDKSLNENSKEKTAVIAAKTQEDENMWNDNDWGEFEETPIKETSKPQESSQKLGTTSIVSKKDATNQDKISNKCDTNTLEENNLWDDEDDWGKLQGDSRTEAEEDLWGEGDGWGVETPQPTPKKEPTEIKSGLKSNKSKVALDNTEDTDLWAEGDNWGISDTTDDSKAEAKSALDALAAKDTSWGGWSNWGISSVLSTAANITTSVSQGLTTVLESGIGVPDPEELARIHKAEAEKRKLEGEAHSKDGEPRSEEFVPFGFSNLVPGVSTITKLVETTGTKVITKGLGTLETIGKKTYEVLQENDPQLKKKRALLKLLNGDKPVLSSILREAKERAETENKEREMRHFARKANYETMFDDYTGLVHLEALEMLSKQCDIKLESILSQSLDATEMEETLQQIKDLCELTAEDDDEEFTYEELQSRMEEAMGEIKIEITCAKVLEVFCEATEWIEHSGSNKDEIHSHAIENLAKLTAMAVEQYHKAGELLLIKKHRSTADEADSLVQLTTAISALIALMATKYTEKLKTCAETTTDEMKTLISNIYLEAANSSRYVEDAFGLLIPVIQVGLV